MSGRGANSNPPTDAAKQTAPKVQGQQRRGHYQHRLQRAKFDGRCDDIKGHIFDIRAGQADQFVKTKKEIALYVGRTYKNSADIVSALDELIIPTLQEPKAPNASSVTPSQQRIYDKKLDQHALREVNFDNNIQSLYSLVWGQCSDSMQAKVEAMPAFLLVAKPNSHGIELLKIIKKISFNYQGHKYLPHAIHESKRNFYEFKQEKYVTATAYLEKFMNLVDILKNAGAPFLPENAILDEVAGTATVTDVLRAEAVERYLATAFFLGADMTRYESLVISYENAYLEGVDKYPKTVNDAYSLLVNWKSERQPMRITGSDGVVFNNVGEVDATGETMVNAGRGRRGRNNGRGGRGRGGRSQSPSKPIEEVECYNCGEFGHYATSCPNPKSEDAANMLNSAIEEGEFDDDSGHMFIQREEYSEQPTKHGNIPTQWILLDNQSTVDVFSNPNLLNNIRTTKGKLTIHCNAGTAVTSMVGDFDRYGTVWYHPKGIANILSLAKVQQKYHVTYDSKNGNMFQIPKPNGATCDFIQSAPGLYYMDIGQQGITLVNTVANNKTKYTSSDYSRASLARKIQINIGRPSTKDFIRIIEHGLLPNCPINRDDVKAAEDIFGPDAGSLKGKTVRHSPEGVRPNLMQIPMQIMDRYRDVTLCGDIMFINRIPFLRTISRNIRFGTAEMLVNRTAATIAKALHNVHRVYKTRGFKINNLLMDGEFDTLAGDMAALGIALNTASNDEHVHDVERYIRTVKERCRAVYQMMPFTRFPARLIIEMVHYSVFWLNSFAHLNGISNTLSPRTIVTGMSVDFAKHCQIEFGAYAQVHEDHDNTMATRTTGAIALRPTGNAQGGYYFMSLTTGRRLNRYQWTPLPMPQDVINRVHILARRNARGLEFLDRTGRPVDNENVDDEDGDPDDATYTPTESHESDDNDDYFETDTSDDDEFGDDTSSDSDPSEGGNHHNNDVVPNDLQNNLNNFNNNLANNPRNVRNNTNNNQNDNIDNNINIDDNDIINNDNSFDIEQNISDLTDDDQYVPIDQDDRSAASINDTIIFTNDDESNDGNDNEAANENNDMIPDLEADLDERYGARQHDHNLRPRRPRGHGHLDMNHDYVFDETMFTQYSMKRGLEEFGEDGVKAVTKELQQLHVRRVIKPVKGDGLSREERRRALEYLMFLKKNDAVQ